jgi:hypothetical protein
MLRGKPSGIKELLAACGRGYKAITSSENAFTKVVTQALKGLQGRPCGIYILHKLLLLLKNRCSIILSLHPYMRASLRIDPP